MLLGRSIEVTEGTGGISYVVTVTYHATEARTSFIFGWEHMGEKEPR